MSNNPIGGATSMPVTGAHCGIKPSKEAMEMGFEVDFSKAKELLENEVKKEGTHQSKASEKPA